MTEFKKRVVIDCKNHILGRLASVVAKELLTGQNIVCVRTEGINITGSFVRNRIKYHFFLDKRRNTNPTRGPFHFRSPAKIFWRTVRGMLPHKTPRGMAAIRRLKVFEGIPAHFEKVKRVVVPEALRCLRLASNRKFTVLGHLSSEVGWKYKGNVERLENNRKIRAQAWYLKKKAEVQLIKKAAEQVKQQEPALHEALVASGRFASG